MKILIAEDDPVSNHVLKTTLKYWGHEILAVPDGAQAWAAMKTWGIPDIIISDWDMPRLSGIELCEKVREDQEKKDIYMILLTAKSGSSDMLSGFEKGVDDYIAKPLTEDELRRGLGKGEKFLGSDGSGREELRKSNMDDFVLRHEK